MDFTQDEINDLSEKIADIFAEKIRKNNGQPTQIQATSEQSITDDTNSIKLKLKGYRTALGVCRKPQVVRDKMRELEAQIPSVPKPYEPIAAAKRFGKDIFSAQQELIMAEAEAEALEIGDGQMVRRLGAKDKVFRLRRELGII